MITCAAQRTDPAGTQRLAGSIVLDCTALRIAASEPADQQSAGAAIRPDRPPPVIVTWDEEVGWSAGLHPGPTRAFHCYLHAELLPSAAAVADFVVGLALGQTLGVAHSPTGPAPDSPPLRLIR